MIHELTEYVWPFFIGLAVISLLIKKSTRKKTINILLGIVLIVLVLVVIGFIEFYLFNEEMFSIIYPFTLFEVLLLFLLMMAFKDLSRLIRLNKFGCRVIGTIIDISGGKGSHYKIRYRVDDQEYVCIGNRLTDKWNCGSNVTVIYSKDDPQESCLEKEDLRSSIILTVVTVLLMIGTIVVECVMASVI